MTQAWRCVVGALGTIVLLAGCADSTHRSTDYHTTSGSTDHTTEPDPNRPWYPSLAAFEHHDSGRSHVFPEATFGGDYSGRNEVDQAMAPAAYPYGWNITYRDAGDIYLYGGGGGSAPSVGSYVAKIDPQTMEPIWYRQLINTHENGEWNYPGTVGILSDGSLYVIYGYRLSKLEPDSGEILATLELPTGAAAPSDTAYNGFNASADGVIVAKSIYREAGCTVQGGDALLQCPDPSAVPDSVLVTVDPKTMAVIDQTTLPGLVLGRATLGRYGGREYVYLFSPTTFVRYAISADGMLASDPDWDPGPLVEPGQTPGWAVVVMNNWVISQSNGLPASSPLSVIAVSQADASTKFVVHPFASDPVPPFVARAFSQQAPGGEQAVSFMPSTLSADPSTNVIYVMDALPGKIAALHITSSGLESKWKVDQTTTEFIAIIGPPDQRAIVATDIPRPEIPGVNKHDEVVWRNAVTGGELARSPRLPAMTSATMVQPSYSGAVFYPGMDGQLFKLQPVSAASP